ncbi:hypothetical protein, partial [Frankia sp. AvcI1]
SEDIPTAVSLLAQAVHAVAERTPGFAN